MSKFCGNCEHLISRNDDKSNLKVGDLAWTYFKCGVFNNRSFSTLAFGEDKKPLKHKECKL